MSEAFLAAIGVSGTTDPMRAGQEAAERALEQVSPLSPKLVVVFGSSWLDQTSLLEGIRSVLGETPLVGASTAGEITPAGPVSHSCVILLVAAETLICGVGLGEGVDRTPREAGQRAAYAAVQELHGSPRTGCLLFGDGLVAGYAEVVRGLQEVLGTNTLIVGGMAGDDLRYTETSQYFCNRVLTRSVVSVVFGGGVTLGVGIEHGFTPIGKPRQITRSRASVLFELDKQPAASVYEEYFGSELVARMRQEGLSRQGIAYPLGIQSASADQWLLRNVVSVGEDGSLSCTGEVMEGGWLQLMIGSRELALEAAQRAARAAVRSLNRALAVVVLDSVVRRTLLGPRYAALEIARIRDIVGPSIPLAGCYTYGEQAPFGGTGTYEQTATQTGSVLVVALGV